MAKNTPIVDSNELPLYSESENEKYKKFLQGTVTNTATTISKKTKPSITNDGENIYDQTGKGGGVVILTNPNEHELSLASSQLLDVITLYLTEKLPYGASDQSLTKFLDCDLPVEDYLKYRGLKDKNQAVKEIKKDLDTLFNVTMHAEIKRNRRRKNKDTGEYEIKEVIEKSKIRIIDEEPDGEIRDYAHFHIALSFARYLVHSQIMAYPLPILLSAKNKNIYYIGKKLAEHYNINQFKKQKTKDKNYIGINALLAYTPEIPTFEEEEAKKKNYRERCIEPLVKTMEALVEAGIVDKWHFTNSKKQELNIENLTQYRLSVEEWKKYLVYFELKDYPVLRKANFEDNIDNF